MKETIGRIVRETRIKQGFTQGQLAQECGKSRSYLCDIEKGRYMPSVHTLATIARALHLNFNFLLEMTEIQDNSGNELWMRR